MTELIALTATAFWLGLLTSISPCPLATNVAAVSFIGRRIENPRMVLLGGLLYSLGRISSYTILGALLVTSALSAPLVALVLEQYMNQILGPLLVLVGMLLLELISFGSFGSGLATRVQARAERLGLLGAFLLGVVFALSFCPVSAALFFGSLLTLALRAESGVVMPAVYGLGTGLPVVVFAVLIALGARSLAKVFDRIKSFELWARRVTGALFIGIGIYYTITFTIGIY